MSWKMILYHACSYIVCLSLYLPNTVSSFHSVDASVGLAEGDGMAFVSLPYPVVIVNCSSIET